MHARIVGEALASVKGASLVDAIVMASAGSRGDVVYTSDVGDLEETAKSTFRPSESSASERRLPYRLRLPAEAAAPKAVLHEVEEEYPAPFSTFDGDGVLPCRAVMNRVTPSARACARLRVPSISARNVARSASLIFVPSKSQSSADWSFASFAIAAIRALTFPSYERTASLLRMCWVSRSTEIENVEERSSVYSLCYSAHHTTRGGRRTRPWGRPRS